MDLSRSSLGARVDIRLPLAQFTAWRKKWDKITSPVERGYHLFCLLTGARPGEAARMTVNDIDLDKRMFVIRNVKGSKDAPKDVHLPITPQIAYALAMATTTEVKPHHEVKDKTLLFPGCRQVSARADLPIRG